MSTEFWMDVCKILVALEICRVAFSAAVWMKNHGVGSDDADPEWEDEVEYASWDE